MKREKKCIGNLIVKYNMKIHDTFCMYQCRFVYGMYGREQSDEKNIKMLKCEIINYITI